MQLERTSTEGPWEERKAHYKPQSTLHNVQTIWKSIPCIKIHCKPTVLDLTVHITGKENPTPKNPNETQHPPHHVLFKASPEGGNFLCRSLLVTAETDTRLLACCPYPTSALVLFPFSSRARCQLGDMESLGSYTWSAEYRQERVTDFALNRSVSFHNKPVKSFLSQLFAFTQRIFFKQESLHDFN